VQPNLLQSFSVMLALANHQTAEALKGVLMQQRMRRVSSAVDNRDAVSQMQEHHYNMIVIEEGFPDLGAADFCRFLRLTNTTLSVAPIIYGIRQAEKERVLAARDAGASKIVLMPLSAKSLVGTLQAAVREIRPFIQTTGFNGPDRRITKAQGYQGPERRKGQYGLLSVEAQNRVLAG
jgi:two-component system, chemotaxis family, chemotaxis protein CheY